MWMVFFFLPFPMSFAQTLSCCVSYRPDEVGHHRVWISNSILESTHHYGVIHLLNAKPDYCPVWFPWLFKTCLESDHHHVMVAQTPTQVLAGLMLGRNRFFTKTQSIWLWCIISGLRHILWMASCRREGEIHTRPKSYEKKNSSFERINLVSY